MFEKNMRYSIGNVIQNKYGIFNDDNLAKFSDEIKVPVEDLERLVYHGVISRENFNKICTYLKPEYELKEHWERYYMAEDEEIDFLNERIKKVTINHEMKSEKIMKNTDFSKYCKKPDSSKKLNKLDICKTNLFEWLLNMTPKDFYIFCSLLEDNYDVPEGLLYSCKECAKENSSFCDMHDICEERCFRFFCEHYGLDYHAQKKN